MSMVNGYQPGYANYPPQGGYPGYPGPGGYPGQPGYGNDAYSQGYQQGANGAAGTANTVAGWGNTMTTGAVSTFGAVNGVVGTAANLLGGVSNMLTGLFGGMGQQGYGQYGQQGYQYGQQGYQQPNYGQYGQQTGAVGPAWGADMAQAQQQVWQRANSLSSKNQVDNLIEDFGDQAKVARLAMDAQVKAAGTAIADLQGAVGRLQQQGGPSSAQGQALLTEIATLKDRAISALTEIDNSSRKVYVAALSAQFAMQYGYQRFGSLNQSACQKELGRAWSFYNGAPAERLHWYSMSKTNIPNAVQVQTQSRQQVTAILTQLDNMLKQSVSGTTTTAPTNGIPAWAQ
jgi:hypothetical protein